MSGCIATEPDDVSLRRIKNSTTHAMTVTVCSLSGDGTVYFSWIVDPEERQKKKGCTQTTLRGGEFTPLIGNVADLPCDSEMRRVKLFVYGPPDGPIITELDQSCGSGFAIEILDRPLRVVKRAF